MDKIKRFGRRMGLLMAMVMLVCMGLPAALSANANIPRKEAGLQAYPVYRSTTIYKGGLVSVNSTGYLVEGTDDDTTTFVGVAYEGVDNSSGSDGDLDGRVYTTGTHLLPATSITQAMVGQMMYLVDDATVDDVGSIPVGTLVSYVSNTSGWVDIGARSTQLSDAYEIHVAMNGRANGRGTAEDPVALISQAFALVDGTRNKVLVRSGSYTEATIITWPDYDCVVVGVGVDVWGHGPTISAPSDNGSTMYMNQTVDGSRVWSLANVTVECYEETASVYAIHIRKTGTAKLYANFRDVDVEQDTSYVGVYVDAAGTSDKFNGEWNGGQIGGRLTCVWGNASDRFRLFHCKILDDIYLSGAYAGVLEMWNCMCKPTPVTSAVSQNVIRVGNCVGYDGNEVFQACSTLATGGTAAGVNNESTQST